MQQSIFSSKITIIEKCNYDNALMTESSCSYENIHPINKFTIDDNGTVSKVDSKILKTKRNISNSFTKKEEQLNLKNDLK